MRRTRALPVAAVALLAVAAGLVPSAGAGRSKRAPCQPGKGQVVQASARAVIIRGPTQGEVRTFYACLRSADRMVFLGTETDYLEGGTEFEFRLAGTYVARVEKTVDGRAGSGVATLSVLDLRKRDGRSANPGFSGSANEAIRGLVLATSGVAAFTVVTERTGDPVELRALTARGQVRIDAGPDLAPESLALAGRRLYWTKGGVPRSAELDALPSTAP